MIRGHISLLTAGFFYLLLHSTWSNWWSLLLATGYCLNGSWIPSGMTVAWYHASPCTKWDGAISLCFVFPVHLGCMVFGARTASVELRTLLKSLKCDCIKIIRRNHKHICILIIMQSEEGEGRKYEIPLKSCQHRSKHKRCLKWEHTVPAWRNYQYTRYPCLEACSQFSFYDIYLPYQSIFHFLSPRSLL